MNPTRLHLHTYARMVLCALLCLAVACFGIYLLSQYRHYVGESLSREAWGDWLNIAVLALVLGCTIGGLRGTYVYLTKRLLWIEVAPRLALRTLTHLASYEWADIESLKITHRFMAYDSSDEDGPEDFGGYELFVQFVQLSLTRFNGDQEYLDGDPFELRDNIIQALVRGLDDDDSGTRQRCAGALGRLKTDVFPRLDEERESMSINHRLDFNSAVYVAKNREREFRINLGGVVPHLKKAMGDSDANVRDAATSTLTSWEQAGSFLLVTDEKT